MIDKIPHYWISSIIIDENMKMTFLSITIDKNDLASRTPENGRYRLLAVGGEQNDNGCRIKTTHPCAEMTFVIKSNGEK
jgi:hypothetical protein